MDLWKLLGFKLHIGQKIVWERNERYILVSAGTGGGKTQLGVLWVLREILNRAKSGKCKEFIIGAPTGKMIDQNILVKFENLFSKKLKLGRYYGDSGYYEIQSPPASLEYLEGFRVYFRHLTDPDVIEGIHACGAWIDEAGQQSVPARTWKVLKDRLRRSRGRVLFTTTPYVFNWLYHEIVKRGLWIRVNMKIDEAYQKWLETDKTKNNEGFIKMLMEEGLMFVEEIKPPDYNPSDNIVVVSFPGILNPTYDLEGFFQARLDWDEDEFLMRHMGLWTAYRDKFFWGFTNDNVLPSGTKIPAEWPRYIGVDFGSWTYFAAVWVARNPETGEFYVYRTYKKRGKDNIHHARVIHNLSGNENIVAVYSDPSGGYRREDAKQNFIDLQGELKRLGRDWEFRQAYQSFASGVSLLNRAMLKKKIWIMNDAQDIILEMENLRTEEVERKKNPNKHCADALRYVVATLLKLEQASQGASKKEEKKKPKKEGLDSITRLIKESLDKRYQRKSRRAIYL